MRILYAGAGCDVRLKTLSARWCPFGALVVDQADRQRHWDMTAPTIASVQHTSM